MQRRNVWIVIMSAITALLVYLIASRLGGVDDWQYTHVSPDNWIIIAAIAAGAITLTFFALVIYLIVKGKTESDSMNPKRKLGIALLIGPVAIVLASWPLLIVSTNISLVVIPTICLGLWVWLLIYAIKNKTKAGIGAVIVLPLFIGGVVLGAAGVVLQSSSSLQQMAASTPSADRIGLAVGGAQDINNFRQNIENGYFPKQTDLTYEGLFYDYFFDTGQQEECEELFCPSYSYAKSNDPLTDKPDQYLSVGLNSGIKDFERKKLNLVVVLDISGSMRSSFNRYHYDGDDEVDATSKMQIATQSVVDLLGHLQDEDRFGMIVYDSKAYLAKPLREVEQTDMEAIKGHIMDLAPRGGTNMEAGLRAGTELFEDIEIENGYENRIIFLTDAMPNTGALDEDSLLGIARKNAEQMLHTTFIGIGVDFNTELIEAISKVKGANYYSVHSAQEFKTRMDEEFEYMVTPLVFDLELTLNAPGYEIEKVYGSPEANEATGQIMKVNTLFPSAQENGETKGGVVLLKLEQISQEPEMNLAVSFTDREGERHTNSQQIILEPREAEYYDNSGIRKAILLSRYADLMHNWIQDEREENPIPRVNYERGIVVPADVPTQNSRWERASTRLTVSQHYKEIIQDFDEYFQQETQALSDQTLLQESELMKDIVR